MRFSRPLAALLATSALSCVIVAARVKMSVPMGGYLTDTIEWAQTGRVSDTFTPLAYPFFLGEAYRLGHEHGIIMLQALLQITLVLLAYLTLRELRVPQVRSALGALLFALSPELVLSVVKIWDFSLAAFLVLFVFYCCIRLANVPGFAGWKLIVGSGVVFACAVACRPNLILMLPVFPVLFFLKKDGVSRGRQAVATVIFFIIFAVIFAGVGIGSHGSPFIPRNGPYNLYAGQNPATLRTLLEHENAEQAIQPSIQPSYPGISDYGLYAHELEPFYTKQSVSFILHHPGTELELVAVKLFTLFRPDTKALPLFSVGGMGKVVLALPMPILLLMLVLTGRRGLLPVDWLLLAMYVIYVLPFLITNSDPRFRTPLDIVMLIHSVSLLDRYWNLREA